MNSVTITLVLSAEDVLQALTTGQHLRIGSVTLADPPSPDRPWSHSPPSKVVPPLESFQPTLTGDEWQARQIRVVRPKAIHQYRVGTLRHAIFMAAAGGHPISMGELWKLVTARESSLRSTVNFLIRKKEVEWVD
jgi:hypothetical protein